MRLASMEAASAAIELREVTRRYKDLVAVDCLTLSVDRGEILGLLGPNGSGKTTTVSMATGLLAPTLGAVEVLGHDMARNPRAVRRRIGSVPQETALYEELSAEANLRFHADLFDVPRAGLAERMNQRPAGAGRPRGATGKPCWHVLGRHEETAGTRSGTAARAGAALP